MSKVMKALPIVLVWVGLLLVGAGASYGTVLFLVALAFFFFAIMPLVLWLATKYGDPSSSGL